VLPGQVPNQLLQKMQQLVPCVLWHCSSMMNHPEIPDGYGVGEPYPDELPRNPRLFISRLATGRATCKDF